MSSEVFPSSLPARIPAAEASSRSGLPRWWLSRHAKELGGRKRRNKRGHWESDYSRAKLNAYLKKRQALNTRPSDPDLIFIEEAENETGCCRQTLASIAKKEGLEMNSVCVLDSLGKAHWRTVMRKSQLRSLFCVKPPEGKSIVFPDGSRYYLRDDAKVRFSFSDIVLSYWSDKPSNLHPGKALRTRPVYIVQGRRQGPPKRVTAWRAKDLRAIDQGKEGDHPERGKTSAARKQRKSAREKALQVLRALRNELPIPAKQAVARVLSKGISYFLMYALRNKAGIKSRRRDDGIYFWCQPNQSLPATPTDDTMPVQPMPAEVEETPSQPQQKRRGRKKGWRDVRAQERDKRMVEAWQEGTCPTVAALGRAFFVSRARARQILEAAGALV